VPPFANEDGWLEAEEEIGLLKQRIESGEDFAALAKNSTPGISAQAMAETSVFCIRVFSNPRFRKRSKRSKSINSANRYECSRALRCFG
jgi:hypothetical protein